ncbi:MAG: hypothetical protein WBB01_05600, partial [Phormidesmis sp.]
MTVSVPSRGFALSKMFCCLLGAVSATLGGLTASALAIEAITAPAETTVESVDSGTELAEPDPAVSTEEPTTAAASTALLETLPEPAIAPPESTDEILAQVTSVSELSDVQPGDWAFTALQRLVEEYG